MNEQLVVKNFGPIKDATVDFKRVTVFIGPTGGGKSTLAKLAAIFRDGKFYKEGQSEDVLRRYYEAFSVGSFFSNSSEIACNSDAINFKFEKGMHTLLYAGYAVEISFHPSDIEIISKLLESLNGIENIIGSERAKEERELFTRLLEQAKQLPIDEQKNNTFQRRRVNPPNINYIPAERIFIPSIEYSWAGLLRDDIGLPKSVLEFANEFSLSRKEVLELDIPFLNVKYIHRNGQDFIKIPESETLFRLYETASGIQSVTPLLVLLEHLSRNTEQAQSFIIEEPELNLFPTAQFELVKILVDKCARLEGQDDLVLTTHSPYILTALNLMCYAFRIAQQDEATAKKVAQLIPRHCWIDPEQFAAYYVDRPGTKRKQQVRSIINKKTGLIEENELDTASDELSAIFDKLVRLRKSTKTTVRTK